MSNYQGFVLRGTGLAAAEAMLNLRDIGCSSDSLRSDSAVMRTYLCEFDVTNAAGRMPTCMAKEFGMHLADYIVLRDPNFNEFEVHVERRPKNKLYFKSGWYGLKDFYKIDLGAWVIITVENPKLMSMALYDRLDEEIDYPKHNLPIRARLDRRLCENQARPFCNSMMWTLTASDVHCGYMVLPWTGFCKDTMPAYDTAITFVDYVGFYWRCTLKIGPREHNQVCTIGGEWGTMCRARNYVVGQTLEILVAHESDNKTVYVRPVSGPTKPKEILTPMTRVISKKSGEALFCLRGTAISVEVERVRRDMLKLNTYNVEFEITTEKARMPTCFVKEYGLHIDDAVMLRDGNNNMIEVRVERKNGKVYIRDGWMELVNMYKIDKVAWIKLTYVEPNLMLISIRNRSGVEIPCPASNPPYIRRLMHLRDEQKLFRFRCSAVHVLSSADIEAGYLTMPWSNLCRAAFVENNAIITVVDQSRFNWRCTIQCVEEDNRMVCKIGGDWRAICALRKFQAGHAVKLGLLGEKGSCVVYLKYVPLQSIYATYIRPARATINERYVYQINHYFTRTPVNNCIF